MEKKPIAQVESSINTLGESKPQVYEPNACNKELLLHGEETDSSGRISK